MSLIEVSYGDIVLRQYKYKLNAYIGAFMSLALTQVIGIIMTLTVGGSSMSSGYGNGTSIRLSFITGDIVIAFTMIWGFITGVLITTQAYRNDDYAFVTNRLTSNLSNIGYLLTASVVGGVSAMLAGVLVKIVKFYSVDKPLFLGMVGIFEDFHLGVIGVVFYLIFLTSAGYLFGVLAQIHKLFVVLIPALLFGTLIFEARAGNEDGIVTSVGRFLVAESTIELFVLKSLLYTAVLLIAATVLSNRLEVK